MDDDIIISGATDRELLEAALLRSATAEALVLDLLEIIHRQQPLALADAQLRLRDEAEKLRDAHPQDLRRRTVGRLQSLLVDPRFD